MIKTLLKTPMGRLRAISLLDGISYLILLGIAMPLKYLGDLPSAVRIPGMIHGLLFILLCLALLMVLILRKLPLRWCVITFFCALLPLAPFWLDWKLRTFDQP
jgi:integral membrane protein